MDQETRIRKMYTVNPGIEYLRGIVYLRGWQRGIQAQCGGFKTL
jgi:hypothetical protein